MKGACETPTPQRQPISKHLQLSLELTVTILGFNNCLHIWHQWIRTCRRNHDLAMTRPARANIMYPIDAQVSTAIRSGKLDERQISQIRGKWKTFADTHLITAAFRSITYLDLRFTDPSVTPGTSLHVISSLQSLTRLSLKANVQGPSIDLCWLGSLTQLQRLNLSSFPSGSDYSSVTRIVSLEHLELKRMTWDPTIWQSLTGLAALSLKELKYPDNFGRRDSLTALMCLVNLVQLTVILGTLHSNIRTLPNFHCFPDLQYLKLSRFGVLSSLAGLDQCPNIRTLVMRDNPTKITDYHILCTLPRLTTLCLLGVGHPRNFSHLVLPPTLKKIRFVAMDIYDLAIFADLPCLEALDLYLPAKPYHMSQPPTVWASSRLNDLAIVRLESLNPIYYPGEYDDDIV